MSNNREYYVYLMTNYNNKIIYIGVTGNLKKRIYQHREELVEGFTKKYKVTKLVYYEQYIDPVNAITREKQLKGGSRKKKVKLIEENNPFWKDLYHDL